MFDNKIKIEKKGGCNFIAKLLKLERKKKNNLFECEVVLCMLAWSEMRCSVHSYGIADMIYDFGEGWR